MRRRINLLLSPNSTFCLALIAVLLVSGNVGCKSYTTGLQKSQARADEASVIAALRNVALAQHAHALTNQGNYATFSRLTEGGYLDSRFSSEAPEVHGYVLSMTVGDKTFTCNADPMSVDLKGRHFYVDSTATLIRVNATQPASAGDEVLKF